MRVQFPRIQLAREFICGEGGGGNVRVQFPRIQLAREFICGEGGGGM